MITGQAVFVAQFPLAVYLTWYPAGNSWIGCCEGVGLEGASLEGGEDA